MSLLELCTLTGVDNSIEHNDLFSLSGQYPFVEWGVLFHSSQMGNGRYPSLAWIDTLVLEMRRSPRAHFALHICGQDVQDFFHGNGSVSRIASYFPRIQLNLAAKKIDVDLLIAALFKHPQKVIIIQHNGANDGLWQLLKGHTNHSVLFDESGGRGISPSHWPNPLPGKRCGYAGGLGPDSLESELPRIMQAAGTAPIWIDMEGNLRNSDDRFDLLLAQRCLSACSKYVSLGSYAGPGN